MFSNLRENKELKEEKKAKKKKLKSKAQNSMTLDLEINQLPSSVPNSVPNSVPSSVPSSVPNSMPNSMPNSVPSKEKEKENERDSDSVNNIDLLYLTNQQRFFKPNKIDSLLNNNYLLKSIYNNLDENINSFKEQIVATNNSNLKELLENNDYKEGQEKHKLYYLLYVLNLIQHFKETKIQNLICEDLKDYSNNYKTTKQEEATLNCNDFNIVNETLKLMSSTSSSSKKLTNIDLMVTKKSNASLYKKILPQKWE
jgi:hypothetical protein